MPLVLGISFLLGSAVPASSNLDFLRLIPWHGRCRWSLMFPHLLALQHFCHLSWSWWQLVSWHALHHWSLGARHLSPLLSPLPWSPEFQQAWWGILHCFLTFQRPLDCSVVMELPQPSHWHVQVRVPYLKFCGRHRWRQNLQASSIIEIHKVSSIVFCWSSELFLPRLVADEDPASLLRFLPAVFEELVCALWVLRREPDRGTCTAGHPILWIIKRSWWARRGW